MCEVNYRVTSANGSKLGAKREGLFETLASEVYSKVQEVKPRLQLVQHVADWPNER